MTFEPKFTNHPKYELREGEHWMPLNEYNKLSNEQKQELDRNYWRFGDATYQGYIFDEMDENAKAHFAKEEMLVD